MVLWYFWFYSFLGYLLEKGFAYVTRAEQRGRKGFLALPLCPVYGLGMLAVLMLPEPWRAGWRLLFAGGLTVTAVEYGTHWAYERFLGVRFWDYSRTFGNLRGRVCLPFSLAWGGLVWAAVTWVQPWAERLAARVPPEVTLLCLLAFTADGICSAWLLRQTGNTETLRSDMP